MHALNASGRQVSLLNDDTASYNVSHQTAHHYSFPNTPELLRSDSYDSQMSSEPMTPITYDYGATYGSGTMIADSRGLYDDYYANSKAPRYTSDRRSVSYDDEGAPSPGADRSGKRYPCRFRDIHGCEKTFTTSGHASRHSKIHTAEKGVQCTHPGCSKKFTRADNMKQHLETHTKEKSSRSSSSRASTSSPSDRKSSVSAKLSSRSKTSGSGTTSGNTPLPSPGGMWDMGSLHAPLDGRPIPSRTASGLDALVAVACQEGA